ncbi:uncharacterized protein LOC129583118 [Paramacrobiotus metropolitanus]|uniref:uncharacterized protein LOC129583118 n=1 Tax=Paramacrobiotus metropolitanus TaxID=2943436 RepID=UPI002445D58E|nr:uncharacterized protein LOC129583118 [Paramacrobiotus metropolitanus]
MILYSRWAEEDYQHGELMLILGRIESKLGNRRNTINGIAAPPPTTTGNLIDDVAPEQAVNMLIEELKSALNLTEATVKQLKDAGFTGTDDLSALAKSSRFPENLSFVTQIRDRTVIESYLIDNATEIPDSAPVTSASIVNESGPEHRQASHPSASSSQSRNSRHRHPWKADSCLKSHCQPNLAGSHKTRPRLLIVSERPAQIPLRPYRGLHDQPSCFDSCLRASRTDDEADP